MFSNESALVFFFLWITTLVFSIAYFLGRKRRQLKMTEKDQQEKLLVSGALKTSKATFVEIINNMNEGLFLTDHNDVIRFINRCACNILNMQETNIIGRPINDFLASKNDVRKLRLPSALKSPGCAHREEVQMLKGNGDLFWACLNISYIENSQHHPYVAIIVMTDISDKKLAQEKLHHTTKRLNQRIKQLDCLFDVSDILNIQDISVKEALSRVLEIIPTGMRFPSEAWAEIILEKERYRSKQYKETSIYYLYPIKNQRGKLGSLRVGYRQYTAQDGKESFQVNEKILIKNIAEKLANFIEVRELRMSLKSKHNTPAASDK